jgi:hypothetical protein
MIFVELPEFHVRLNNEVNCEEVRGNSVFEIKITAVRYDLSLYHALHAN